MFLLNIDSSIPALKTLPSSYSPDPSSHGQTGQGSRLHIGMVSREECLVIATIRKLHNFQNESVQLVG